MRSEVDPALAAFEYVDDYGHTLTARPSFDLLDTACVRTSQAVFVKAEDLPGMVAKLYQAAGQEPPIILPRPAEAELREHGWVDGQSVNASAGHRFVGSVPAEQARTYAAHLAAAADLAEAEPDPAQLKHLTALIDPWSTAEANARAILAAGYVRAEDQA